MRPHSQTNPCISINITNNSTSSCFNKLETPLICSYKVLSPSPKRKVWLSPQKHLFCFIARQEVPSLLCLEQRCCKGPEKFDHEAKCQRAFLHIWGVVVFIDKVKVCWWSMDCWTGRLKRSEFVCCDTCAFCYNKPFTTALQHTYQSTSTGSTSDKVLSLVQFVVVPPVVADLSVQWKVSCHCCVPPSCCWRCMHVSTLRSSLPASAFSLDFATVLNCLSSNP